MSDPHDPTPEDIARQLDAMLGRLGPGMIDDAPVDTLEGQLADEFFQNNYEEAGETLLSKTDKLQVTPYGFPPRSFRFRLDRPYIKQAEPGGPLAVSEGPVTGEIFYRRDLFSMSQPREIPTVAVVLSRHLRFFHPNVSLRTGHVCIDLDGVVSLECLCHSLVAILSFSVFRCSSPLNRDAARTFAERADEILRDLPPMEPLY